jgi:RHS repeat-associated protein/uncharacterized repeat protein (TIGR01451 family)
MPRQIGRSIRYFHRLIAIPSREFARKSIALALIILMPAQTLPAGAPSQGTKNQNTFQKSAPQVLLPPGGLDSLLKTLHASEAGASNVTVGPPSVLSSNNALAVSHTVLLPARALPTLAAAKSMPAQFAPLPPSASSNGIAVSVGYADNLSPSINFPSPWQGAPNVSFYGAGPNFNAGAIRLDNATSRDIALDSVTIDLQRTGPTFSLWQNVTIPANGSAILTQSSAYNFNTSGYPIVSCGGTVSAGDTRVPKITLTIGGTATDFLDTAHVLDTGGFDLSCRGNRSLAWRSVGTTGIESPGAQITLGPDGSISATGITSTFAAQVSDAAGQPLANAPVSLTGISGPNAGLSAATISNAQGAASFSYSSSVAGSDLLQANLPNLTGSGVASNRVTANWTSMGACPAPVNPSPRSTSLIYLGQTSVHVGDTISAAALLQDASGNAIPARPLTFRFQGQALSATTDGSGVASTTFKADAAGAQSIGVSFAGATTYQPSSTSSTVSITRENTFLTYTGATLLGTGAPIQLTAQLKDLHHNTPLANQTLTFQLGTVQAKAVTDSTGTATASLTLSASEANGPAQIQVSFAGDANYNPSFVSNPAIVYQASSFVIWGGNPAGLHLGQDVNFWGAQWAKQVTGGNYAANNSFKGFAQTATSMQLCIPQAGKGQNGLDDRCWMWNSKPGQSVPPATLPTYIEAIVSTAIATQGSEIFGNIAALVVLKVDPAPAYGPDPGKPGFGAIVAVIADEAAVFPLPVSLSVSQSQPTKVLPGQTYGVNAAVTNTSPQSAINVAVGETFDGTTPVTGSQTDSSLSPSSQFTALFSQTAPSFPGRQPGETSSVYESRLAGLDGRFFTSSGTITFSDAAGQPYLPIETSSFSQLELPRLAVSLNGPVCGNPGQKISYTVKVTNLGNATAAAAKAVVTLPDGGNITVPISNLGAGMSFASTVNYQVPPLAPKDTAESTAAYLARLALVDGKSLAASVQVNWQDTQGNSYGDVDAQFSSTQQHVPIVSQTVASLPTLLPGTTATLQFNLQNSGGGNAIETDLSTSNPNGTTSKAAPFSVAAGQSATTTATWKVPVPAARMSAETNAAYQARLAILDGNPLNFAISLRWTDAGGSHYGPTSDNALTTEILPNLTLSFTGPATAKAGDAISYAVSLQNLGHAPAPAATLVVTLPDGTTVTPSVPTGGLAAGTTFTSNVPFKIGSTLSGNISSAATLTWQDANGNNYGPRTGSVTTQVTTVAPANQPPVVTVGPDQTITYPTNTASLTGTATDDGFPVGSTLQISWSKVVGPGNVTFLNAAQPNTQATFSLPGNYILRLSASDGQYTSSGTVRIAFTAPSSGGITVSAGPDQVIVFPNSATLSGSAGDSAPGSAVAVGWSLVSGPGTASFANPGSLSTTVTFSAPGVYDLRLTASDGTFTATSNLKIYAGNVQCTLSNKGTDFWLIFIGAIVIETTSTPPRQLSLFISSDVATSGTVSVPGQQLNLPFSVVPGQIATVNLPQSVQVSSSDLVESKGIHVTAQNPVAVYGLNFVPFASDAYMGLPTNTLGTSYLVASYRQTSVPLQGPSYGTEFGVAATQDNTTVTIVPTSKAGSRQALVPFTIQLNQGQSYQLRNSTDGYALAPSGIQPGVPVDLTGSVVTSDKPVAVFGGHDCTTVPNGFAACNHLVEQLPPVNLWGQNFVTMPLFTETNGDVFRFLAQVDNTHVQVNHQQVAVLLGGQFFEQVLTGPAEISADQPILTIQYAASNMFTGNTFLDPTMIVVPPFEQFGGSYTVNSQSIHEAQGSDFPSNYINVIAPTAAAQASAVVMDGSAIPPLAFRPIGTSPFSGAQLPVAEGPHVFTGNLPFGVWAYGFNSYDAYGYTGGVCLSKGVPNGSVTASPKSSTNQITSQVTVQAAVVDSSSKPVGGAGVTFAVTGVNPQSGSATTNSSGVASFTFTGFNKGSDLITVTSGTASDSAGVTWVTNGPNQPPVVSAGPSRTISLPVNSVFLAGSVVDDGLPAGGTLTIQWSQVSGPAGVSFATPNQAQTNATFPQAGIYVLQLTANDSQLSSSSSVTVTVLAANAPPVVSAGPPRTFLWILNSFQTITVTGTASDDGLPVGSTLTVAWSMLSGPGPVTFSSPNSVSTAVTFPSPGTYALRLSASDGQFTSTSDMTVNALGPIALSISSPQAVAVSPGSTFQVAASVGSPVQLTANATVNGQPVDNRYAFLWGADIGAMTFSSATSATTNVTFSGTGANYIFVSVAFSPVPGDSTGTVIYSNVLAAVSSAPTVSIATPTEGGEVTNVTQIIGSVSAGNWTLDYARQDDFNPLTFTTFATGSGPVNGPLGTFDPTLLLNGTYVIRLTTLNGSFQASTSVIVNVTRNVKVGVFTVSFNDLTVPVAGIPIQVIRTYDSRDKGQGDFGVGWRLSLADVRLQKSRNLGLGWQESVTLSGPFQIPTYCLDSTTSKIVTITFPGGKVYRFQAQNSIECQNFGPIIAPVLSFTQLPGPAITAGATLTPADGGQAVLDGSIPGPQNFFGFDGNVYNPTAFMLKTADGTRYGIDQKLGLTSVTDVNGNTLTITPSGIISSTGKSIPFTRDQQGRIIRITDPNGNVLRYSYDPATGNLSSYTDRANSLTGYLYDSLHDLTELVTADNNIVLSNNYDPSGRLVNTNDGLSHRVNFTHNIAAQTEAVQDRNGNSTTYAYDADGNVIQTTDPLGNISSATYDANDNKLTETNALGKTSIYTYDAFGNRLTEKDPLGNTTIYRYNALNKPLTITDANLNVTTNSYDTLGNLLTNKDPLGNITTNTYFPNGTLKSTQDALQHTTSFTYDGSGNLLTQTDTNGTVTSYAYDANGNRTSQSVKRTTPSGPQTLTTTYLYDGNNRLVKTTNPDSTTTQVIYNSVGQQVTTIDALNRKTSYSYDLVGRLAYTTYPDNSNDATNYDNNGNRLQYQARGGGLTTNYTYDALNCLTQTQNNVAGTTKTSYDAAGQVLTTTDANGNVTTYTYDDAGRRSTVIDALNHVTTFGYDGAGNQTTIKDANNNITTFTYDGSNRRTKVTYPDGKFESTGYDALGRVTSRTDANGIITQYNYDALGRLISVVQDAAPGGQNLLTSYTYDEVGNRLTQTDANAHTTSSVYDQRGRRTQRTLPLGQSESYAYDAAGNLQTRTDFNGKTTTYTYNLMNQLLSKIPDPSFNAVPVTITYETSGANIGMRMSMTDASGTTNYTNNGTRLARRDTPVGTVSYSYDPVGNVLTVSSQTSSSIVAGTAITYTYDKLNRLSTVATSYHSLLSGTPANGSTTTYAYDNVGNLQSVTYPNGVVHNYTYDTRNRLKNLGVNGTVSGAPGAIAGYAYTLDAAGHRTSVTELSGRTVNYGYDNLYRLTSEALSCGTANPGCAGGSTFLGAVNYTYDAVGNRKQMSSTLAPIPAGLFNYDANDRFTAGDTYDNDGNTVSSGGVANVYDFENHLIQQGGVSIKYDGDGNRIFKTVAGATTGYLLDDRNPTGYVQVLDEVQSGAITRSYVYGLELIEQDRINSTRQSTSYNVYDGHGSVRALTDMAGAVTDTYDYDAFGNIIHSTGSTPNVYLFAGEQFDPNLHLYYNRARYLNVTTGRFWSIDTFEGDDESPISLHKYLYSHGDPLNNIDPSGNEPQAEVLVTPGISLQLDARMAFEILKAGARVLALACSVGIGIAAVAGGGACGVNFNEMRVQLQEGTTNTFGIPLRAPSSVGVTTLQVRTALLSIYLAIYAESRAEVAFFPKNASDSFIGLLGSVIYLSQRVGAIQAAGGVPQSGQTVLTDTFLAGKRVFRIDIENLRGHNLRL